MGTLPSKGSFRWCNILIPGAATYANPHSQFKCPCCNFLFIWFLLMKTLRQFKWEKGAYAILLVFFPLLLNAFTKKKSGYLRICSFISFYNFVSFSTIRIFFFNFQHYWKLGFEVHWYSFWGKKKKLFKFFFLLYY